MWLRASSRGLRRFLGYGVLREDRKASKRKGTDMGIYYRMVNLDRREYISPATFGNLLKAKEFTEVRARGGVLEALTFLLMEDAKNDSPILGRWAGDRVVIAASDEYGQKDEQGKTLYQRTGKEGKEEFTNIGPEVAQWMYLADPGFQDEIHKKLEKFRKYPHDPHREALRPVMSEENYERYAAYRPRG